MTPWHTAPIDADLHPLHGWVRLPSGVEITARPLVDDTGAADWARLTYRDALVVAARLGGRLPTRDEVLESIRLADHVLAPMTLSYGPEMVTLAHAQEHDRRVRAALGGLPKGSIPRPRIIAGIGKHWVAGAAPGRSRICGWPGPGGKLIQAGVSDIHDDLHHDYATTTLVVRAAELDAPQEPPPVTTTPRPTIRLGSTGEHVAAWQRIIGASPDGAYGPRTLALTRAWQAARGLVADGIVGAKSWALAGELHGATQAPAGDPRAPACVAALRDANAAWPGRDKASDGIMGDDRHQKAPSDHNLGNAVDIDHDPSSGCDGNVVAAHAIQDPRVTYVIWDRRIYNRTRMAEGWRRYTGANGHTHHCHISVRADARDDASPWAWAP